MATTIKLKNGSGAPLAGDLVQGEPALDLTNKRLYTEDSGGTVIEIGTSPSTIDINAGTIDGTVIGGSSAAAGTFTTFTSTGIDDNATSTAITIDASENVGIGETTPSTTLTKASITTGLVAEGTVPGFCIQDTSGVDNAGYWFQENGTMVFQNYGSGNTIFRTGSSGTETVRIDSSGNVGIGTTSPSVLLAVEDLGASAFPSILITSANTETGRLLFGDPDSDVQGQIRYDHSDNSMAFRTSNSEAMRIDSNGQTMLAGSTAAFDNTGAVNGLQLHYTTTTGKGVIGTYSSGGTTSLAFRTNSGGAGAATDHMLIDGSGNVGIGTTSPFGKLETKGSGTTSSTYSFIARDGNDTSRFFVRDDGVANFSGNVGIGTASPSGKLNIDTAQAGDSASSSATRTLLLAQTSTTQATAGALKVEGVIHPSVYRINIDSSTGSGAAAPLSFSTSNSATETMRIDSSGNVGIGTSSPTVPLHVEGSSGGIKINRTGAGGGYLIFENSGTEALDIRGLSGGGMSVQVGGSGEAMRIDSSGNLLVGKTSAGNITDFGGEIRNDGTGLFSRSGNSALFVGRAVSTGDLISFYYGATTPSSLIGSISTNGTSTSYNPSSDARLKENIRDYDNALADVMKLKPRKYSWKADGAEDNGFIAQELLEIPEFANRVNPLGDGDDPMYGVDYMKFVAVLTGAIQEQQAMIEELKAEVAALKGA